MANEKRLIDANALEKDIRAYADNIAYYGRIEYANGVANAVGLVYAAPTVDAVEVVHGRWAEKIKDERFGEEWDEIALYECSVCKSEFVEGMGAWRYCPNCGAKMDGDGNG
jgi:rubrerythrin